MNQTIRSIKNLVLNAGFSISGLILVISCSGRVMHPVAIDRVPVISPDYCSVTIPPNIAPLNFQIKEKGDRYVVKIYSAAVDTIKISSSDGKILLPSRRWKAILRQCKGSKLVFDVFVRNSGQWAKYRSINNHIANEPIDDYLVYRLFDQGFLVWNRMGIYQRCLSSFDESPLMLNTMSDRNCINCHSFCRNDSKTMLFHMRGNLPGTIIRRNGKISRVNTRIKQTISPGVYPAWNPDGRHVAFSVNHISNAFYSLPDHRREAIDSLSDVIVYDCETNKICTCEAISARNRLETFPTWSPDGCYLYYLSAVALPPDRYREIRYDLLRIGFDTATHRFGTVDTVISSYRTGMSISFPRISPDSRYLLFCTTEYGNFTIWHKDSELNLLDLTTNVIAKPGINSDQAESYHSWSSDGRWIVFSSRRDDGNFTRLYISYFDRNGKAYKPFILPQKDPEFYDSYLKTYNVPELITSKVELNPRILSEAARAVPVNASAEW